MRDDDLSHWDTPWDDLSPDPSRVKWLAIAAAVCMALALLCLWSLWLVLAWVR